MRAPERTCAREIDRNVEKGQDRREGGIRRGKGGGGSRARTECGGRPTGGSGTRRLAEGHFAEARGKKRKKIGSGRARRRQGEDTRGSSACARAPMPEAAEARKSSSGAGCGARGPILFCRRGALWRIDSGKGSERRRVDPVAAGRRPGRGWAGRLGGCIGAGEVWMATEGRSGSERRCDGKRWVEGGERGGKTKGNGGEAKKERERERRGRRATRRERELCGKKSAEGQSEQREKKEEGRKRREQEREGRK